MAVEFDADLIVNRGIDQSKEVLLAFGQRHNAIFASTEFVCVGPVY